MPLNDSMNADNSWHTYMSDTSDSVYVDGSELRTRTIIVNDEIVTTGSVVLGVDAAAPVPPLNEMPEPTNSPSGQPVFNWGPVQWVSQWLSNPIIYEKQKDKKKEPDFSLKNI